LQEKVEFSITKKRPKRKGTEIRESKGQDSHQASNNHPIKDSKIRNVILVNQFETMPTYQTLQCLPTLYLTEEESKQVCKILWRVISDPWILSPSFIS
jgi:hypothetical protein